MFLFLPLPNSWCRLIVCHVLPFTLLVVDILWVMAGMRSWSEVLITVGDQRGERVDCMRGLHYGDFVGLWRKTQERLQTTSKSDDIVHKRQLHFSMHILGSVFCHVMWELVQKTVWVVHREAQSLLLHVDEVQSYGLHLQEL